MFDKFKTPGKIIEEYSKELLPLETRKSILQVEMSKWISRGYRVQSQTDTNAQMLKGKRVDGCLLIILLCLGVVPGLIYLVVQKDKTAYITIDERGKITIQ